MLQLLKQEQIHSPEMPPVFNRPEMKYTVIKRAQIRAETLKDRKT
jgi:hypothetical protein